jgi:sulfate adenylyltransferase
MDKKNAISVSENMITSDGLFWPVPIINLSNNIDGINVGDEIALLDPNVEGNPVLAIQKVSAIEKLSSEEVESMADKIFGTTDERTPWCCQFFKPRK